MKRTQFQRSLKLRYAGRLFMMYSWRVLAAAALLAAAGYALYALWRNGGGGTRETESRIVGTLMVLAAAGCGCWFLFRDRPSCREVREDVLRYTRSQRLREMAVEFSDDSDWRELAVGGLDNQALLQRVAAEDQSPSVRARAVRNVEDEAYLSERIRLDPSEDVRLRALAAMEDTALLRQVARDNDMPAVRRAAVKKITDTLLQSAASPSEADEAFLYKRVRLDPDEAIRLRALAAIKNPEQLFQVARDNDKPAVRKAAVERIKDSRQLRTLLQSEPDASIRMAELVNVTDTAVLSDVIADGSIANDAEAFDGTGFSIPALRVLLGAPLPASFRTKALLGLAAQVRGLGTEDKEELCLPAARELGMTDWKGFCPACGHRHTIERIPLTREECVYSSADNTIYEDVEYGAEYRCSNCQQKDDEDRSVTLGVLLSALPPLAPKDNASA